MQLPKNMTCPRCGVESLDAALFGLSFANAADADLACLQLSDELGCQIFYDYNRETNEYELWILEECVTRVVERNAPTAGVDSHNYAAHYLSRPYNLLETGLNLGAAIIRVNALTLEPDQAVQIDYGHRESLWGINTSLNMDQTQSIKRISDDLSLAESCRLVEIDSFKDWINKALEILDEH